MTIRELIKMSEDVDADLPVYVFVDGQWQEAELAFEEAIVVDAEQHVRSVFCVCRALRE